MKALNLFNLLKQFHYYEGKKKNEMKEIEPIRNLSSGKRHVKFINQKMVMPLLVLMSLFAPRINFASNNQNLDACTVSVTATSIDIVNAGCGGGAISMNIGGSELYSYEVRSVLDLDLVLISSLNYESGTIQTPSFLYAGDYIVNVETITGCIGQVLVTVNQPPCPSIVPNITAIPASVNGSYDGEIDFNFIAVNSCFGNWTYNIYDAVTNNLDDSGIIPDPASFPSIVYENNIGMKAGDYILKIFRGTTDNNTNECNYISNFTITEPPCDIAFTSTSDNPTASSCNNGSIHLDITGNTAAGYYIVDLYPPAGGLASQFYATEDAETGTLDITGLSGVNYEIIVHNGAFEASCFAQDMIMLTEPVCDLNINTLVASNSIAAGCNNGTLDLNLSGETCSEYYLVTLLNDGINVGTYYPTETSNSGTLNITGLSPGNYTLEVSNVGLFCTTTQTFIITEPACNIAIADFAMNNPTINLSNNGSILFNAQGANCNGTFYYELYESGNYLTAGYITVAGSSSPASIAGLSAGSYELKLLSSYGSNCMTSQLFTLNTAPCNITINSLLAQNIAANGCGNGVLNFNISGSTAYGYYDMQIEKDGSYYSASFITPTGTSTPVSLSNLEAGIYTIMITDGAPTPCTTQQNITITESACNVLIANTVLTEISVTGYSDGAVTGSLSGTTCSGTYLVNLFNSGNFVESQVVQAINPVFTFPNLMAGLYEIQAFSGENVGNTCFNEYGFLLIDPCPVGNLSVAIDSTLGPCDFSTISISTTASTDPTKLYIIESAYEGGPWNPVSAPYFGHTGLHTAQQFTSTDGHYEVRSGPLAVINLCNLTTGFNVYKRFCDATFTGITTLPPASACANGRVDIAFNDPTVCIPFFRGVIYQNGDSIDVMDFGASVGSNHFAYKVLPAGNYTYIIYTNTSIGDTNPQCPISGSFTIPNGTCNITFSNEVIINDCNGTEYSAQINGITCHGQFLAELYKDGNLIQSNNIYENSTVGIIGYGFLSAGNYNVKVFSNHLNPGTCFAESNFMVNPVVCDLSITNLVITNAAADLSTFGSINFNVSGTECFGFQVILKKNGQVYFANNVTPTGTLTPVSFASLPPDNYEIIFSNGFCEVSQTFTILQGNPSCNLQVSVSNSSNPITTCFNGSLTVNMQGNANGNNYVLNVTKAGNSVFSDVYPSGTAVTDVITNLSAGVYNLTLSYTGSGACISNANFTLTNPPCNLSIGDVVITQTCDNLNNGVIAFDVNGIICEESSLQLLNSTGATVINTTIATSEGRLFENLAAGNYNIQVTTPYGCNINYPVTVDPVCTSNIFDENIVLEGAGSCTTGKLTYHISGSDCSQSYIKLINNIDMTIVYQSNAPDLDGVDEYEIGNIPLGNYTLQLTNNSGNCTDSYNFTIDPAPCSNIQFSNVTLGESTLGCSWAFGYDLNLGNCPGSVLELTQNGTLLNTYNLNTSVSTEINYLVVGNYNLHLTTASGCNIDYPFVVNPTCNLAINNPVLTQTIDNANNGSIAFNLSGDICNDTPLQLLSGTGSVLSTQLIDQGDNYSFNGLSAGNYSIQAINAGGCSVNYPFVINAFCDINVFNETVSLEGAGSCTTGKLSYYVTATNFFNLIVKLINTDDLSVFYQSNVPNWDGIDANEISNIPSGNYTLQIINASGNCTDSYNFTIDPAPCSNIQFSNVTLGESTLGCSWAFGYDLNLGNCPGSVLTLSKDGSLLNTYNFNSSTSTEINYLVVGNYNLHLTSGSGSNIDYPFVVNPTCNLAVNNPVLTQTIDNASNGSIAFNFSGDICNDTPLQLLSGTGSVLSTQLIDQGGNYTFNGLDAGNYSIQVTNAGGCSVNYPFAIDAFCDINVFNETVSLEGAGSCTTAKLSYYVTATNFFNLIVKLINSDDLSVFFQSNVPNWDGIDANEISNIPSGNYTLQILNASGNCSDSYNFSIAPAACSNIQFSNVTINPSQIDGCYSAFGYDLNLGNCPGSVLTLDQNGSIIETYNLIGSVSTEITDLTTGNYNLHLSSAGCEIDYPFTIAPNTCNITLTNSAITNTGVATCSRGRIDFDVNGTTCGTGAVALVQNGSILNTINWTSGNGGGLNFSNLLPGDYSIVAVNNLFNVTCGDTITFNIPTNACVLSISNILTTSTGVLGCTSGTVTFTTSGTLCQTGLVDIANLNAPSVSLYNVLFNNLGNQTFTKSGLPAGTYIITFGNLNCYIEETFTIAPNVCNLSINNVVVTNVSGSESCTMANVTFTPMGDMCSNGFIQLMQNGSSIGTSILWNQNTAPNISFANLSPGIYSIFAATYLPNFCSTSYNFEVLPTPCSLNIASISSTPSNGSNGTINVTGTGNYCGVIFITLDAEITAGNYNNITTNTGNLATQFTGLAPGNYRVTISSAGSTCQEVEYIIVTGAACNTNPIISTSSTTICPGLHVTLNSNYLTGNVWSNGGTSFNTNVSTAGTYTLTVTELNGCTGTTSITINNATNCVPATQMNNGVCGALNFVRTSAIGCVAVSGATQYEWQFSNTSGVFATKTTTTNYVLLHNVTPTLNWGTNWDIKVRAKIGANAGPYSPNCNIGIILDPSIYGVPQTQLRTQDCNKQNYRINADNRIIANPISGAIQYEFEFSSAITGLVVATKLMTNNVLFLNTVTPALVFPAQYNVRARARISSTWGVFGTPCLIGITGLNREEEIANNEIDLTEEEVISTTYFDMMVMPNPFNEQAALIIRSDENEQVFVEVFDMIGNIVWKQLVQSNTQVNFGLEIAQGTYIVKAISSKGEQAMFRFIKSK